MVVVYKIDRLTRALTDFARMVELFDRHEVSFVSVTQSTDPFSPLTRIEVRARCLHILMPVRYLPAVRARLGEDHQVERDPLDPPQLRLTLAIRMKRQGAGTMIIDGQTSRCRTDRTLINALRAAHAMVERNKDSLPVLEQAPSSPYGRRLIRLAFLAPDLQRAILEGRQPSAVTLKQLMKEPIPLSWTEQRRALKT